MAGTIDQALVFKTTGELMMAKSVECTNRFLVRSESGRECYVNEFTEYVMAEDRSGQHQVPGMKFLETDDGHKMNYEGKGRYELVMTRELFTSDEPNAP